MSLVRGHDIHPGAPWVWRDPDALWPQSTCSFCGSIQPDVFLTLLRRDNATVSGSDWKYGWPHKFYAVDAEGRHWKFYSEHLLEVENFEELAGAISDVLHITFKFDNLGRLGYSAPSRGYQTWLKDGVYGA